MAISFRFDIIFRLCRYSLALPPCKLLLGIVYFYKKALILLIKLKKKYATVTYVRVCDAHLDTMWLMTFLYCKRESSRKYLKTL